MSRRDIEDLYPLSPMQQGMLFHSLSAPASGIYFEQSDWLLHGALDVSAFQRAWQRVVNRQSILRTAFLWEDVDEPLQVVYRDVELPLDQQDWRELTESEQHSRMEELLRADRERGFSLSDAPLMRLSLIRTADATSHFVWSVHHLLVDGWSLPLIFKEVIAFYEAFRQGREIPLPHPRPYRDYIAWLQNQDLPKAEEYWRATLRGFNSPTPLLMGWMTDSADRSEEYALARALIPSAKAAALHNFAQDRQVTLNTLAQGAWGLLLSKYSGEDDVVFGATVSGRPPELPDSDSMVGLFINTLPVRVQVVHETTVISWLQAIQAKQSESRQFEYSPLFEIQGWSEVPRHLSLFESILVFENYPVDEAVKKGEASLTIERSHHHTRTNYPITLAVSPGRDIGLEVGYDRRRFDPSTIDRMLEHLQTIMLGIVSDPNQKVSHVTILNEAERKKVLVDWNTTAHEYPATRCIHQLIADQAERTPDAVAVVLGDQHLSYRELNKRANQLAHHLRKLGVREETLVGVYLERSLDMVAGLLGVLKSGAAYLPLDPSLPVERVTFMLRDAGVSALITREFMLSQLPDQEARVVCLDRDWQTIGGESDRNPRIQTDVHNLAYVIYTSGSTGTPKGITVPHQGIVNHADWTIRLYDLKPNDRVLQFISLSFDAAAEEIFPTLAGGATLVMHSAPAEFTGREMLRFCGETGITILHLPVAYWHQLVNDAAVGGVAIPDCLKFLLVGGESPSPEKLETWTTLTGNRVRFLNAYGPTEATITTTVHEVEPGLSGDRKAIRVIPIGRPIQNVNVYLLDVNRNPLPVGVPGELYIGGAGLVRGYLRRPDLTALNFLPNPFGGEPGSRMYRTGDLARFLPDGSIEFVGRVDFQVKIRGFRIELGEIEARLSEHPSVGEAVVIAREDAPGDKRLVAYLVSRPETTISLSDLQSFLKDKLPEYMIPSAFVVLGSLPLTSTGKTDRRALPAPEDGRLESGRLYVPPRTSVEELLVNIWSGILGVSKIGVYDNFFELGGHSLRATQLVSRIRDVFSVEIPLQSVFEAPLLADLARRIETATMGGLEASLPALEVVSRDQELPLSFAQQRLWFLDQLAPGGTFYSVPAALRLRGSLDVETLEKSLSEVVRRHEVLRTTFVAVEGKPRQIIAPAASISLPVIDLTGMPEDKSQAEAMRITREEALRPFDLANGPLFRASIIRLGSQDHVFVLTLHHIIADGWSISILVREVAALYQSFSVEKTSPLPELTIQYADYAHWQRQWLQGEQLAKQLSYWKEQLSDIPPVLELPTDRPRPAVQTFRGGRKTTSLPRDLADAINELSRKEGVTAFMILLAAFQALLHRYTGQRDILVGSPIAGRKNSELERLIGFFVNNIVLRTTFAPEDSFREVLHKVRTMALSAYAHQDLPFEKLVEELHPVRDLSHSPIFQVMFVFQNVPVEGIGLPGLTMKSLNAGGGTSNYDLSLVMQEGPQGYIADLEYNADLFDESTISRMLGHFEALVRSLLQDPDQRVSMVPYLSPEEAHRQLTEWNTTAASFPSQLCVHEWFETLVEKHSDAVAVTYAPSPDADGKLLALSYDELNKRSNQLGHYLRTLGVGPEKLVGICTERSLEMIIGIMGTLKAGGAFVPLDPAYPRDRLAYMLEDSGLGVLLTQEALKGQLPQTQAKIVCLDSAWPVIEMESIANPGVPLSPDGLAYVIYTSGSTGKPKGTMLRHLGLSNLATVQIGAFDVHVGSKILQFSSLSFDASVWETVMALLSGSALCLTSKDVIANADDLVELMIRQEITTVTLPPSVLAVFPEKQLPSLRTLITAGEKCTDELVQRWGKGRKFFNAYGPTESTVCASMHLCDGTYPLGPPIGKPISNFGLYIVDANLQPVPPGVAGELLIGGVGLARGYLHQPDLTAEKFIPHPFGTTEGARLYRTGDLCRFAPDGNIEFLGRIDDQVKVRGFRIELGEIEAALREYPSVRDVVVLAREDRPGDRRLVAYLVAEKDAAPSSGELRSLLRDRLPEYMVPSVFMMLDAMPLTPNKKIDRKALPAPDQNRPELENVYVAPRNDIEAKLVEITAQLLNIERVGVYDNFFDLGGHSLLATQFISRVRDTFKLEVALRTLFEKPTIADLALEVERIQASGIESQTPKIKVISREAARVKRSELTN